MWGGGNKFRIDRMGMSFLSFHLNHAMCVSVLPKSVKRIHEQKQVSTKISKVRSIGLVLYSRHLRLSGKVLYGLRMPLGSSMVLMSPISATAWLGLL